jgi:hypothetical protein
MIIIINNEAGLPQNSSSTGAPAAAASPEPEPAVSEGHYNQLGRSHMAADKLKITLVLVFFNSK